MRVQTRINRWMRVQTRINRYLGLNAGRQRREAASNREVISQDRRAEVFRQDTQHTGNAGDPMRKSQLKRAAKLDAAEPMILQMRAAGATYAEMIEATGLSQQNVAAILSRNGMIRRQAARLK